MFIAEIALTPEEQRKGLMGRASLTDKEAMLFALDTPRQVSFWMKNMLMSIDIIYFDEGFKLLKIFSKVPPCTTPKCDRYISDANKVKYILEIRSGLAKLMDLTVGDAVKIPINFMQPCQSQ